MNDLSAPCPSPVKAGPIAAGPAPRRINRTVQVGAVTLGGGHPVVVQSMTNTDTADIASTVKQVA